MRASLASLTLAAAVLLAQTGAQAQTRALMGSNETLFTILSTTGFATAVAGPVTTIAVDNVYCEEKTSSKKVKCTASQSGQVLEMSDSKLFLSALRGEVLSAHGGNLALEPTLTASKKVIYTLTALKCTSRVASSTATPFYSCTLTPFIAPELN